MINLKEMSRDEQIKQIQNWHNREQHNNIREALEALPPEDMNYDLTCLLARAYNNLAVIGDNREKVNEAGFDVEMLGKAAEMFKSVAEEGESDSTWHVRLGYSLFYLATEKEEYEEALYHFKRSLEINPQEEDSDYFIELIEDILNNIKVLSVGIKKDNINEEYPYTVNLFLNAKFQPEKRGELEDALNTVFGSSNFGVVDGGGTMVDSNGEISSCDINIALAEDTYDSLNYLRYIVNYFNVPKGSEMQWTDAEGNRQNYPIGNLEGLALYLDGQNLSPEVYENYRVVDLIDITNDILNGVGSWYDYWESDKETALYYYGDSFAVMEVVLSEFINTYPLCENCRVVQIA